MIWYWFACKTVERQQKKIYKKNTKIVAYENYILKKNLCFAICFNCSYKHSILFCFICCCCCWQQIIVNAFLLEYKSYAGTLHSVQRSIQRQQTGALFCPGFSVAVRWLAVTMSGAVVRYMKPFASWLTVKCSFQLLQYFIFICLPIAIYIHLLQGRFVLLLIFHNSYSICIYGIWQRRTTGTVVGGYSVGCLDIVPRVPPWQGVWM